MLLRMTAREDSLENTVKTKESLERRTAGERGLAADERDIGISEKKTPSLQFKMCSKFAMFFVEECVDAFSTLRGMQRGCKKRCAGKFTALVLGCIEADLLKS